MSVRTLDQPAGQPSPGPQPRLGKTAQEWLAGYSFLAPAAIIIFLFIIVPILFAVYISFTDWTGVRPVDTAQPVGALNYRALLGLGDENGNITQQDFFTAIKNTSYYVLGVVPTQTALALLLA